MFSRERTEKTHLNKSAFSTFGIEVIDALLYRSGNRTHRDNDIFGVGGSVVVEEAVAASGEVADLIHILLNDGGKLIVEAVVRFANLEENISVLYRGAQTRMVGIQCLRPEGIDRITIEQFGKILIFDRLDLAHLVGGAESIEKVQKRDTSFDRRQMGDGGEIHDLLRACG